MPHFIVKYWNSWEPVDFAGICQDPCKTNFSVCMAWSTISLILCLTCGFLDTVAGLSCKIHCMAILSQDPSISFFKVSLCCRLWTFAARLLRILWPTQGPWWKQRLRVELSFFCSSLSFRSFDSNLSLQAKEGKLHPSTTEKVQARLFLGVAATHLQCTDLHSSSPDWQCHDDPLPTASLARQKRFLFSSKYFCHYRLCGFCGRNNRTSHACTAKNGDICMGFWTGSLIPTGIVIAIILIQNLTRISWILFRSVSRGRCFKEGTVKLDWVSRVARPISVLKISCLFKAPSKHHSSYLYMHERWSLLPQKPHKPATILDCQRWSGILTFCL